ncbi:flagellar assembly peptidoglycan hydrolase FlgJ [Reinekea sp.]|jgi:flagellar protein FlgJ|uniref:flagellar assembly peptidoglycan hydrolase FlgJ n=1 Tax=Reinekea sp. TaxID=1970455 RepID=UPI002A7F986D|nr:flagellar assembly peptidoglycan hydrolase FlgJ [Reinekea sp.]
MTAQLDAAFNYNDLNGLNTLKQGARKDDPEALMAVAQQFESMFLGLIMKSMRDATDVLASDLESSYQTKFYRDMSDQQMSLSMSQNGGFGLADVLYEQISKAAHPEVEDIYNIDVKTLDHSKRPVLGRSSSTLDLEALTQVSPFLAAEPEKRVELAPPMLEQDSIEPQSRIELPLKAGKSALFDSPEAFIASLMPHAEKAAQKIGLEPKILLAQAALETGWGQHVIADQNGQSSHNLFGIKADQRWQGDVASTTTHEFIDGRQLTIKAPFRAYESIEDSFDDYVQFVQDSPRYQAALAAESGDDYLQALQAAGYATDPRYAEKISRIANSDWFSQA